MVLKKMKNQSKQTIKVDYSPDVLSAIKAEAKAKKISFNRVIELMAKKFVDRCGTPERKVTLKKDLRGKKEEFFCKKGAVHPTPKIKRIIIVEVA